MKLHMNTRTSQDTPRFVTLLTRGGFWKESVAIQGSISPRIVPHVLIFGAITVVLVGISDWLKSARDIELGLSVIPFEYVGVALGLLLVLRTNSGYERWWEARKLWGGVVNQSRNVAISALAYGPPNGEWRSQFVRWAAVFPHACRQNLRGDRNPEQEVVNLIGRDAACEMTRAEHMPSFVALRLAALLRSAYDDSSLSPFAFLQVDRERALLIDHIGACERILKTPLPPVYSIKIRRFILMFLLILPFSLLHRLGSDWLIPLIVMLVAYPLLSLDQIGIELQNPFVRGNLSHLPLDAICQTIEGNLLALLDTHGESPAPPKGDRHGQGKSLAQAEISLP